MIQLFAIEIIIHLIVHQQKKTILNWVGNVTAKFETIELLTNEIMLNWICSLK